MGTPVGGPAGPAGPPALAALIRDVDDFPSPGIVFKDLTPLLRDAAALRHAVDAMVEGWKGAGLTAVAGIESRGFILGAPVAERLGVGFIPVRKPGKLPWRTERLDYSLEYGTDALEVHADAVSPGERVLVVDDVLATGGTAQAAAALLERVGAEVAGLAFLLELAFLDGRARLAGRTARSVLVYP